MTDKKTDTLKLGEVNNFNKVHFSSLTDKWDTPESVYHGLDNEFNFNFDPCLSNYKKRTFFDEPDENETDINGLLIDWGTSTFCNPPYSEIERWVKKAYREAQKGKTIVLLIPSRTDTRWWHDYIMKADKIRLDRKSVV